MIISSFENLVRVIGVNEALKQASEFIANNNINNNSYYNDEKKISLLKNVFESLPIISDKKSWKYIESENNIFFVGNIKEFYKQLYEVFPNIDDYTNDAGWEEFNMIPDINMIYYTSRKMYNSIIRKLKCPNINANKDISKIVIGSYESIMGVEGGIIKRKNGVDSYCRYSGNCLIITASTKTKLKLSIPKKLWEDIVSNKYPDISMDYEFEYYAMFIPKYILDNNNLWYIYANK